MKPILCFDLGGTLIRFENAGSMYASLSQIMSIPEEDIRSFVRQSLATINCKKDKAASLLIKNFKVPDNLFYEIENILATKSRYSLFPDTIDTLDTLRQRGYIQIIMSNAISFRTYSLEEMGLSKYICFAAYSFNFGYTKPQQEFFREVDKHIARSLECRITMIGDSYTNDICGAFKAGWDAVYVNRQEQNISAVPCLQIHQLSDLLTWFP